MYLKEKILSSNTLATVCGGVKTRDESVEVGHVPQP